MITKSAFKELSMEHSNGNYFLRPDRILGCFQINHNARPKLSLRLVTELEIERSREAQLAEKLVLSEAKQLSNVARIDLSVSSLWSSLKDIKVPSPSSASPSSTASSSITTTTTTATKRASKTFAERVSFSPMMSSYRHMNSSGGTHHKENPHIINHTIDDDDDDDGGGGGGGGGDMDIEMTSQSTNQYHNRSGASNSMSHKEEDDDDANSGTYQKNPMGISFNERLAPDIAANVSTIV
jgi:hypothetical protein